MYMERCHVLWVIPVSTSWAQKTACEFVLESTGVPFIAIYIMSFLAMNFDQYVDDSGLEPTCVVTAGLLRALVHLNDRLISRRGSRIALLTTMQFLVNAASLVSPSFGVQIASYSS